MLRIAQLFIALATAQFGELKSYTGRRVGHVALLAFFGLLALGFGLAAATTALAAEFGLLYALLIMAGAALFGCVVLMIVMNLAERKHRRLALEREEMRARLKNLALMTALGGTATGKPGIAKVVGLGVVGLATLLAVNSARRKGGDDDA